MDASIANFIPNAMQFVAEYMATKGADALFSFLKNRNQTSIYSIEAQFIRCLDTALAETCNNAGWEYNDQAIEQTIRYTNELIKNNDDLQTFLPKILSMAIGHPFDESVYDIWMDSFVKAVVLPENEELYKMMMYYNTTRPQFHRYNAKSIYDYLSKPFDCFKNNVIRRKAENRLHDLVDAYAENEIISSSGFRAFFQRYLQLILPQNAEYYQRDTYEADICFALNAFFKQFGNFPSSEQKMAIQLIKDYIICYINVLLENTSINFSRNTISSNINGIFISFEEQQAASSAASLPDDIFEKSQKTLKNFASILKKELPFEMENGKTLSDVYISPEYIIPGYQKVRDDIFVLLDNYMNRRIKTFFEKERIISKLEFGYYHALFIIGSGGMGKSSLLAKLAYDIQSKGILHRVFFLKFSKIKDRSGNILDDIISQLGLSENDLRQSVIVLDAYDEFTLDATYDKELVMQEFCAALYQLNALAIVTTRPGYVNTNTIGNSISVFLCTFSSQKRMRWVEKYDPSISQNILQGILNYKDLSDEKGRELIGTPIILYMVAANKIDIGQFKSRFALYNRLFGSGGLWMNRRYDENHPLLKRAQTEIYALILNVALAIFNQRKGLSISREHIETLIEESNFEDRELVLVLKCCYPLVTYFKNDINLRELEFAHKSIYEFYVAAKLFADISKILEMDTISANSVVRFAIQLKGDYLSSEVMEFYSEMICQKQIYLSTYQQAGKMLESLCANYFSILKDTCISNSAQACNAFFNAFTAISKVLSALLSSDYIEVPQAMMMESLRFYLGFSTYTGTICLAHFNLKGLDFSYMRCKNADFSYANLEAADLSCGDFSGSIFREANLKNANLYAATLSHAVLIGTDLRGSFLRSVRLNKSEISMFSGVHIDSTHIQSFTPEIYYAYELFRIYLNGIELNDKEKETTIQNVRGF